MGGALGPLPPPVTIEYVEIGVTCGPLIETTILSKEQNNGGKGNDQIIRQIMAKKIVKIENKDEIQANIWENVVTVTTGK